MDMNCEIKMNLTKLDLITAELNARLDAICRSTAFAVEYDAKSNCRVDTGACRGSIYTVTSEGSTYEAAKAEVAEKNPDVKMMDEKKLTHKIEALVTCGVNYGIYLEYGSVRIPNGPYPFMVPAFDKHSRAFVRKCKRALGTL